MSYQIQLIALSEQFSVHQYDRDFKLNPCILDQVSWYTVSKTRSELSLIVPSDYCLPDPQPKKTESGWCMFQVDAQMDFGLVGILARIVSPLKEGAIPVFVVSTFDTDYVMVKQDNWNEAQAILNRQEGIAVTQETQ
ncbi:ACT domain-containing protein [Sporodiniella umbellata]|nr:ACT domain-containing protein [Sporodiniella umbellata]